MMVIDQRNVNEINDMREKERERERERERLK